MRVNLAGLGLAVPTHAVGQADLAASAVERCCTTRSQRRLLPTFYAKTTVARRGSVLVAEGNGHAAAEVDDFFPPPTHAGDRGPSVAARMQRFAELAPPLAHDAAARALTHAGVAACDVDQVVLVTCTGFASPGVDFALIERLGLRDDVGRTQIGFMGCHGAVNGLRVARGLALADPGSSVLAVCVELCTLHFQYGWEPPRVLANALFADGAAAAVLQAHEADAPPAGAPGPAIRLIATGSRLVPDSAADMTWDIAEHGFVMSLSPRVPGLIRRHLRPWLDQWLASHGVAVEEVAGWAIHPGGPRVVTAAGDAMGVPDEAMANSRDVLREHGNMSSPTVLFVLQRLLDRGVRGPIVLLAFGPGLVAEAALVEA